MPPEATTQTPAAPASALPESVQSALPEQKADYGAADLFKSPEPTPDPKTEAATAEPAKAPVVEVKTLASKWASKVKAPVADLPPGVKQKADTKTETVEKPESKPATETPPAAQHPEDVLELPTGLNEKAGQTFKAIRNEARDLRQRLAAATRERDELKSKPSPTGVSIDTAEVERLRAEHKEAMDRLLVLDTANHPVFQAQYVKPRNEALNAAADLLKAHGKDANLAALIEKPRGEIGKALAEILDGVPQFDQAEISANVRSAWKLAQDEKVALAKARETKGAINQQDSQTHVQAFESRWNKVGGSLSESLEIVEIPANATPEMRRGIEEYNQAMSLDSIKADARKLALEANSYEAIADASMKAVAYDRHIKHIMPRIGAEVNVMLDTIKALNAELDGYRSRNPNRDISPSTGTEAPAASENVSYEEGAAALFGKRR